MSRVWRTALGISFTVILLIGIARASATPIAERRDSPSRLRLSWSARPERIETCRVLTPEELSKLEEHMRQRVQCEGRFASYLLRVSIDGVAAHEAIVRGAGLRNDRPIYLLRDIGMSPGVHALSVTFTRRERAQDESKAFHETEEAASDTGIFAGRAEREATEHARRARAAIPPRLQMDTSFSLRKGEVGIVTIDPERPRFVLLTRKN